MKWFGKSWGATVCTEDDKSEWPRHQRCIDCDEFFVAEDRGVILTPGVAYHVMCLLGALGVLESDAVRNSARVQPVLPKLREMESYPCVVGMCLCSVDLELREEHQGSKQIFCEGCGLDWHIARDAYSGQWTVSKPVKP